MVRSALSSRRRTIQPVAGAEWIPAATVLAASSVAILPVVSLEGWWPSLGLLMLVAWRMHRADAWPAWWAAPLGFFNDLVTPGLPIGFSVTFWPALMLAMDLVDRRTEWRGYIVEWVMAGALVAIVATAEWWIAALMDAPVSYLQVTPAIAIEILLFPVALILVERLDRWRLGQ